MHPHFQQMALTSPSGSETGEVTVLSADNDRTANIQLFPPRLADMRSPEFRASVGEQLMPGNDVARGLSRRELVILRTLTEGASSRASW
jgi:hypothetical protein